MQAASEPTASLNRTAHRRLTKPVRSSPNFYSLIARTPADAMKHLHRFDFDAVVLNYVPDMGGQFDAPTCSGRFAASSHVAKICRRPKQAYPVMLRRAEREPRSSSHEHYSFTRSRLRK